MKRIAVYISLLLVAGIILIFGVVRWWHVSTQPVSGDASLRNFVIPRGRSAAEIGARLASEGFIRNSLVFKIYVQTTGKAKKIRAGQYRLSPGLFLNEIVDQLTQGPVGVWVTVPEGLRREEVAERFVQGLEIQKDSVGVFRQEFLIKSNDQEGFLFPDTYLFPRTASPGAVLRKLSSTFDTRVDSSIRSKVDLSDYTLSQVVILASIVERETRTGDERPIVAGILLKRLEADWPLQADATVQYAVANENCKLKIENCNWWPVLTGKDLEINSPYNSYKFAGLPPSPIANPGLSSIKAIVYPQESPYWYYLHDSEGQIHYAATLEEHSKNVREFLGK